MLVKGWNPERDSNGSTSRRAGGSTLLSRLGRLGGSPSYQRMNDNFEEPRPPTKSHFTELSWCPEARIL